MQLSLLEILLRFFLLLRISQLARWNLILRSLGQIIAL